MQQFLCACGTSGDVLAGLAERTGLSDTMVRILAARGLEDEESVHGFLHPDIRTIPDPMLFEDMDRAIWEIEKALEEKRHFTIYGDYDVDGVTSTSLLYLYFKSLGAKVDYYIPDRRKEGYGLNLDAVDALRAKGTEFIITVDNGITSRLEVEHAKKLGMGVVVTDHHECPEFLPDCAVINPKRGGYPFAHLAGVGVAAKLVQALGHGAAALKPYLDLIALGTVADLVPLIGENRILVRYGMAKMGKDPNAGISALMRQAGYEGKPVNSHMLAYGLGPRVNAGGRIGSAWRGVELFTSEDASRRAALSAELDGDNTHRKELEDAILRECLDRVNGAMLAGCKTLVLAGEGWNAGVIGIVASRLVERFHRPTVLFALTEDGKAVGSGRSIKGVHLYEAMKTCEDLFLRFGGHEMAAGATLLRENLNAFDQRLDEAVRRQSDPAAFIPTKIYDAVLPVEGVTLGLVEQLDLLEPTGQGNPPVRLLVPNVHLGGLRRMGQDGSTLGLTLEDATGSVKAVGFRMGDQYEHLCGGGRFDVLMSPQKNVFNGRTYLQCVVHGIKDNLNLWELEKRLLSDQDKFIGAFCRQILYNRVIPEELWKKVSAAATEEKADSIVKDALSGDVQGTLILCFTPGGARYWLRKIDRWRMLSRMDIAFGRVCEEGGYNTLVMAPDLDEIDFASYRNILLADGALHEGVVAEVAQRTGSSGKLTVFLTARQRQDELDLTSSFKLDREALASAYRAFRGAPQGADEDLSSYVRRAAEKAGQPGYQAEIALAVFRELDFCTVTAGRVRFLEKPAKMNLAASALFQRASGLAEAFGELWTQMKDRFGEESVS
ncbi:single-stranded-DNA-specific exonuclease RecJ [Gehongia tenuis]|uniref:Single-stranded-DNA-specific exonuclease RecJ n=1 Tax=Gehongia tenuis TaxID=2763655 RepID=A0A926HKK3_9FIRM|nr:single-stranded-DNA-specific exonuclease RecJ [Gehongia tenuis]MBC8531077.1 single-stranded-DNA-specific exonuclease RecJ [Gehongia tenuis]